MKGTASVFYNLSVSYLGSVLDEMQRCTTMAAIAPWTRWAEQLRRWGGGISSTRDPLQLDEIAQSMSITPCLQHQTPQQLCFGIRDGVFVWNPYFARGTWVIHEKKNSEKSPSNIRQLF